MNKAIKENRVGSFIIINMMLKEMSWDHINSIFKDVLIIRAEYLKNHDVIEYTAYSEQFDRVDPGCEPFKYFIAPTEDCKSFVFNKIVSPTAMPS